MSEISDRYEAVAAGFATRVAGIAPEQWSKTTPCTEWTVRDLVAHVVGVHRNVVSSLGESGSGEVDAEGDLGRQFGEVRAEVEAALTDHGRAEKVVSGMFGEQPFESLVSRLLCADTLIHTWDLARATGQPEALDIRGVEKAAEFLTPIDEAIRRPGGFSAKIEPPEGADAQTRLLNFAGRAPE